MPLARAIVLLVVAAVAASLLTLSGALAHAGLVATSPAEGARLDQPPAQAIFTFTEPVAPIGFSLLSPDGSSASLPVLSQEGAVLGVGLPSGLGEGGYLLSWRVTSADGHPINGVLSFGIGSTAPPAPVVATGGLGAAIWAVRLAQYVALFVGVGGVVFGVIAPLAPSTLRVPRLLALLGLGLVPVALALQGLDLTGEGATALMGAGPWLQAVRTSFALTQTALGAAFLLAIMPHRGLLALAGLAGAAAPALSGHAATAEPQALMRAALALHVGSVMAWTGALWPLTLELGQGGVAALRRFSRLIPIGVGALVLSGGLLAMVQLGPSLEHWLSPYGVLLGGKLGLVGLLLALALWNRVSLTGRALAGAPGALRRSIAAEIVLVCAVLGLVAGWRFTTPPRVLAEIAAASEPLSLALNGTGLGGSLRVSSRQAGTLVLTVLLDAPAQEVSIDIANPAHAIATRTLATRAVAPLQWQTEPSDLPVGDDWTVVVKVRITRFEMQTLNGTFHLDPRKEENMDPRHLAAAAALALSMSSAPALAESAPSQPAAAMPAGAPIMVGELEISGGFTRATLPNAPVGAGFLTIVNKGATDDRLVAAQSPIAGMTQIHEMKMEGEVMKMQELADGLVIPAGGTVVLAPGGYHLMFMQLKQPLVEGTSVPLTLVFEKAGTVKLELAVGAMNASEPTQDHAAIDPELPARYGRLNAATTADGGLV